MSTIMADKLKEAGVKVTMNQRVWNYLNDYPKKTGNEIAKALRVDMQAVYAALYNMLERGMVWSYAEKRNNIRKGQPGMVNIYSVRKKHPNDGYEILPLTPEAKAKREAKAAEKNSTKTSTGAIDKITMDLTLDAGKPEVAAPAPVPQAATGLVFTRTLDIENMTLREIRELRDYLNTILR